MNFGREEFIRQKNLHCACNKFIEVTFRLQRTNIDIMSMWITIDFSDQVWERKHHKERLISRKLPEMKLTTWVPLTAQPPASSRMRTKPWRIYTSFLFLKEWLTNVTNHYRRHYLWGSYNNYQDICICSRSTFRSWLNFNLRYAKMQVSQFKSTKIFSIIITCTRNQRMPHKTLSRKRWKIQNSLITNH